MRMRILAAFLLALLLALLLRTSGDLERSVGPQAAADAVISAGAGSPAVLISAEETSTAPANLPRRLLKGESAGCVAESVSGASIKWMIRRQNPDGSWGGDAEVFEGHIHTQTSATALTMLALLAAGYTHLTKDEVDGKRIGDAVKAGVKWLAAREPADAFEAALASLALSEALGLTNAQWIREGSRAALDRFEAFQRFDGTRGDALADTWAAVAWHSAKLSELEFDAASAERTATRQREALQSAPTAEAAAVYLLLTKDRAHESLPGLAASIAASPPDWEKPEFTRWFFATLTLHQLEGPGHVETPGESWKTWSQAVKEVLVRNQLRDGTWPGLSGQTGTVVRTAMATMSLEVYYRYSSMMGVR